MQRPSRLEVRRRALEVAPRVAQPAASAQEEDHVAALGDLLFELESGERGFGLVDLAPVGQHVGEIGVEVDRALLGGHVVDELARLAQVLGRGLEIPAVRERQAAEAEHVRERDQLAALLRRRHHGLEVAIELWAGLCAHQRPGGARDRNRGHALAQRPEDGGLGERRHALAADASPRVEVAERRHHHRAADGPRERVLVDLAEPRARDLEDVRVEAGRVDQLGLQQLAQLRRIVPEPLDRLLEDGHRLGPAVEAEERAAELQPEPGVAARARRWPTALSAGARPRPGRPRAAPPGRARPACRPASRPTAARPARAAGGGPRPRARRGRARGRRPRAACPPRTGLPQAAPGRGARPPARAPRRRPRAAPRLAGARAAAAPARSTRTRRRARPGARTRPSASSRAAARPARARSRRAWPAGCPRARRAPPRRAARRRRRARRPRSRSAGPPPAGARAAAQPRGPPAPGRSRGRGARSRRPARRPRRAAQPRARARRAGCRRSPSGTPPRTRAAVRGRTPLRPSRSRPSR